MRIFLFLTCFGKLKNLKTFELLIRNSNNEIFYYSYGEPSFGIMPG